MASRADVEEAETENRRLIERIIAVGIRHDDVVK